MYHPAHKKSCEGVALVAATLMLAVGLLVLGALTMRVVNQSHQVDNHETFKETFQGLESAYAQSKAELELGADGMIGLGSWTPDAPGEEELPDSVPLPDFYEEDVSPARIPNMQQVEYMAFAQDWSSDNIDNNGDGIIDGVEESGFFTIHALAKNGEMVRQAEIVLAATDINVWNNAVFAGAGHVTGAIQGNCSLHGSVHLLGTQVPEGGEVIVVLEMTGTSLIHNNYGLGLGPGPALPARLRDSVPHLPQTLVNGEVVDTLNANLRVRNGLISLNGSSEIGQADVFGNPQKETMDGTYNEDGWTGNSVIEDGGRGDPTVVFSDNGWDHGYDLGTKVEQPFLTDDWRWPASFNTYELGYFYDPAPGSKETSLDGDPYVHTEFFSDVLSDGSPYNGDVVIQTDTNFYLNLSRPGDSDPSHRVKADPAQNTSGDDYLYYNAATNVLEVNGQIEINGDLTLKPPSGVSNSDIYYTGRGAILAHGNVNIDTSLYTCNNGNPNDYANSFPSANALGIMAEQDMTVGSKAQLQIMGAFYAQGSIISKKQTVVMGTFVANYFDMGSQVPDIFQVPELARNLPLGMVGNWPLLAYEQVSWREV
jgi:hypothetical protein